MSRSWKTRPVFISSTFQDMQAERDYLNDHVFPELKERLLERFHHLELSKEERPRREQSECRSSSTREP